MKSESQNSIPEELVGKQPRYPDGKEQYPLLSQPLLHELLKIPFSRQVAARAPGSFVIQITARGSTASEVRINGGATSVVSKVEAALAGWPRGLLSAIATSLNREVKNLTKEDLRIVKQLDLISVSIDDAGLMYLPQLTNLRCLSLSATEVADDGLDHLAKLTTLRELSLEYTRITDIGLEKLSRITELRTLLLDGTQVTDAGLVHLAKLTNLQSVWLAGTQVTDAGLAHLGKLSNLKSLGLIGTQVTDVGINRLREAMPHCNVYD